MTNGSSSSSSQVYIVVIFHYHLYRFDTQELVLHIISFTSGQATDKQVDVTGQSTDKQADATGFLHSLVKSTLCNFYHNGHFIELVCLRMGQMMSYLSLIS
jgi:hypothetical protein